MTHRQKVARFLDEAVAGGVGRMTAAPPLFRLAWKLGMQIPPPHFLSFASLTLLMGGFFCAFWGAFMWIVIWRVQSLPFAMAFFLSVFAGLAFGLGMASFYRATRPVGLPAWHDYGEIGQNPAEGR